MFSKNDFDLVQVLSLLAAERYGIARRLRLNAEDHSKLCRCLGNHEERLVSFAQKAKWAKPSNVSRRIDYIARSFDCRLAAAVTVAGKLIEKDKAYWAPRLDSLKKLEDLANISERSVEGRRKARLHAEEKISGGTRFFCSFPLEQRIKFYALRDAMIAAGVGYGLDYHLKGMGGIDALAADAYRYIQQGFVHFVALDVENFYPSLGPGHLAKVLPLSRETLGSILSRKEELDLPLLSTEQRRAYQGQPDRPFLPQGAPTSPLAASAFLAAVVSEILRDRDVVVLIWGDDITIGARSKEEAIAAAWALTKGLEQHFAGPVHLAAGEKCNDLKCLRSNGFLVGNPYDGFLAGGFILRLAPGEETLRVQPTRKSFIRLERRIIETVLKEKAIGQRAKQIAEKIKEAWLGGHWRWRDAPGNKEDLNWLISQWLEFCEDLLAGCDEKTLREYRFPKYIASAETWIAARHEYVKNRVEFSVEQSVVYTKTKNRGFKRRR